MGKLEFNGEHPVILFAVSVACAYVVSPGRDYPGAVDPNQPQNWGFSSFYSADPNHSVALKPRYDAHFVPVKLCGRTHCVAGTPLLHVTNYQAAVEGAGASELLQRLRDVRFAEHITLMQLRTSWWRCRTSKRCRSQLSGSSCDL